MTTGERIKNARKKAGMTQQQLAEILGVNFTVVSQYEHDRRNPKRETLRKIAAAIGVPERELTGDSDYQPTNTQGIKKEPTPESGLAEKLQRLSPELFEKFSQFLELAIENPESAERFLSFAVQALQSSQSSH